MGIEAAERVSAQDRSVNIEDLTNGSGHLSGDIPSNQTETDRNNFSPAGFDKMIAIIRDALRKPDNGSL